jgi:hypothetical protein
MVISGKKVKLKTGAKIGFFIGGSHNEVMADRQTIPSNNHRLSAKTNNGSFLLSKTAVAIKNSKE